MLGFIRRLLGRRMAPITCPPTQAIRRQRQYRSADVHADLFASLGGTVAK